MKENPWRFLAAIARLEVGQREEARNDGMRIREYWTAVPSYPNGWEKREPWCGAFVSWCVLKARQRDERLRLSNRPASASVAGWIEWLEVSAQLIEPEEADAGCVVTFKPAFSHIGIVFEHSGGKLLSTVEGNTDGSGGRDGDGVYLRSRLIESRADGSVWRLPCRPSGLAPGATVGGAPR